MKKTLILLGLSLLLAVALLAGCTGGSNDPVTTTPPMVTNADPSDTSAGTGNGDPAETVVEEVTTDYFEANRIETVAPDTSKDIDMSVTGLGYDIYQLPEDQDWGYRYGVTYL